VSRHVPHVDRGDAGGVEHSVPKCRAKVHLPTGAAELGQMARYSVLCRIDLKDYLDPAELN
jgi:hypothetical protein